MWRVRMPLQRSALSSRTIPGTEESIFEVTSLMKATPTQISLNHSTIDCLIFIVRQGIIQTLIPAKDAKCWSLKTGQEGRLPLPITRWRRWDLPSQMRVSPKRTPSPESSPSPRSMFCTAFWSASWLKTYSVLRRISSASFRKMGACHPDWVPLVEGRHKWTTKGLIHPGYGFIRTKGIRLDYWLNYTNPSLTI